MRKALAAISAALALAALLSANFLFAQQPPPEQCLTEDERERVRAIMIEALDDALHAQIKTLFGVWMKDEHGQPNRAAVGTRQAVYAYQQARKSAVNWKPLEC